MHGPRFADTDFMTRPDDVETEATLGISERGMELLHKINEIIDLVSEERAGGERGPIVIEMSSS